MYKGKEIYQNLKDGKHLSCLFCFIGLILNMFQMESLGILVGDLCYNSASSFACVVYTL